MANREDYTNESTYLAEHVIECIYSSFDLGKFVIEYNLKSHQVPTSVICLESIRDSFYCEVRILTWTEFIPEIGIVDYFVQSNFYGLFNNKVFHKMIREIIL
ncbi:unnamed protein product [Moneuplotes crassus]|uniref:Uncharacterized protein n=1 Tax=Euplotes crassus TaxID=5936 RepID=A0AAD1U0C9_EUPCR|nr:unnamed protein product [Moneuplotes crassus]